MEQYPGPGGCRLRHRAQSDPTLENDQASGLTRYFGKPLMPLYEYECSQGHRFDIVAPMTECRKRRKCECGKMAKRIITAPRQVMPDFEPFVDNTGTIIGGRASYREHLKRTGGIELGKSDIDYQTAEFDKKKAVKYKDPDRKRAIAEEFEKRGLFGNEA